MQIQKCSSDLLKTAEAPEAEAAETGRDNGQIAQAISDAATALGMITNIVPVEAHGAESTYIVYCRGRRNEITIKYTINAFGTMDAEVFPKQGGAQRFDGWLKIMREIVANAVKDANIGALPVGRGVDTLAAMDPNHYLKLQAQTGAQAQPNNSEAM